MVAMDGLHTAPTMTRPGAHDAGLETMALDGFLASVERRGFRMAELALGHREDALDAVQDTMVAFLAYRERPQAEWPALFFAVLRSRITDRHRRNAVRRRVLAVFGRRDADEDAEDPLAQLPDPGAGPDEADERQRAWSALGVALRTLPRRQREAFLLRELQGLSVAEAAIAMGCSEGSVKTHLFRAQAALRKHLEDWR
jgi:RNA polymerase sigma-70 factor (ECF subfamily)